MNTFESIAVFVVKLVCQNCQGSLPAGTSHFGYGAEDHTMSPVNQYIIIIS
jgi:hypothetical protein